MLLLPVQEKEAVKAVEAEHHNALKEVAVELWDTVVLVPSSSDIAAKTSTPLMRPGVPCRGDVAPRQGHHVLTAVYDHTDGDREERRDFNSKSKLLCAHPEPKREETGMDRRCHGNIDLLNAVAFHLTHHLLALLHER
jgi:hypothetical protein